MALRGGIRVRSKVGTNIAGRFIKRLLIENKDTLTHPSQGCTINEIERLRL
jgi:hypothetical protein